MSPRRTHLAGPASLSLLVASSLLASSCHTLPPISPRDSAGDATADAVTDADASDIGLTDAPSEETGEAGCPTGEIAMSAGCRDEPKSCVRLRAAGDVDSATCTDRSCCSYSSLPGEAAFNRGYDSAGNKQGSGTVVGFVAPNAAAASVKVAPFYLDDFEVTVGRFRMFLADWAPGPPSIGDGAGAHPSDLQGVSGWDRAWDSKNDQGQLWATSVSDLHDKIAAACAANGATIDGYLDAPAADTDRLPMTCVTWFEAFQFCLWDDARDAAPRLPIETEWSYAAVGGEKYLPYPWQETGGAPTSLDDDALAHANVSRTTGVKTSLALEQVGTHVGDLPSYFGPMDLAGNAYEMVRDWVTTLALGPDTAPISAGGGKETNTADGGTYQYVVRGGSYYWAPINARGVYRNWANQRYADVGWRCARDAE